VLFPNGSWALAGASSGEWLFQSRYWTACTPLGSTWSKGRKCGGFGSAELDGEAMSQVKRVYAPPAPNDGIRVLVERLWPRGIKREALRLDEWLKEVAPSDNLRRWLAHDPARWEEFQHRYFAELDGKPEAWKPLLEIARRGNLTLLYSARDIEHNNAVALKRYLEAKLGKE